jgi:hypothetical protein
MNRKAATGINNSAVAKNEPNKRYGEESKAGTEYPIVEVFYEKPVRRSQPNDRAANVDDECTQSRNNGKIVD